MITVEVHMHGNLRRFLPDGVASMTMDVPDGMRVAELAESLKAQEDVWVAAIDKVVVPMSAPLADGACLDLFPILEGG
jgi:sulfur carrier protein ThiS